MAEVQRIAVEGGGLAYTRQGSGEAIVLLHGIPTNMHLWRNISPKLAAAGFEVIAFDLLGYGASDKPDGPDLGIDAQAKRIAQALVGLGVTRATLVGHDIGGGVAQLMAVSGALNVQRLVLVDSILYDSFPEPGIARLKDPAWDGILGAPDFDLSRGFSKGLNRGLAHPELATEELVAAYAEPFQGVSGRLAYLRAARALRTEELASRMDEVEQLDIPVLIVWGGADQFQPVEFARRLDTSLRDSRLEVIENAGHFLPEDSPERLADMIATFMTAQGGFRDARAGEFDR